jgi:hypothetical protein
MEVQCLFSHWYMAKQLAAAPTSVCETATNEFVLSVPFLCAVHFMFHGLARPEIANQLENPYKCSSGNLLCPAFVNVSCVFQHLLRINECSIVCQGNNVIQGFAPNNGAKNLYSSKSR